MSEVHNSFDFSLLFYTMVNFFHKGIILILLYNYSVCSSISTCACLELSGTQTMHLAHLGLTSLYFKHCFHFFIMSIFMKTMKSFLATGEEAFLFTFLFRKQHPASNLSQGFRKLLFLWMVFLLCVSCGSWRRREDGVVLFQEGKMFLSDDYFMPTLPPSLLPLCNYKFWLNELAFSNCFAGENHLC